MEKNTRFWHDFLKKVMNSRIEVTITNGDKIYSNSVQSKVFSKIFNTPALEVIRRNATSEGILITLKLGYNLTVDLLDKDIKEAKVLFFDEKELPWFSYSTSIGRPAWLLGGLNIKLNILIPFKEFFGEK